MRELMADEIDSRLESLDEEYRHLEQSARFDKMKLKIVELEVKLKDARHAHAKAIERLRERNER